MALTLDLPCLQLTNNQHHLHQPVCYAGLQQYYPDPSELVGALVCVAANLKPAKLAGEPSQAMVLAADATGPDGSVIVKALQPPGVLNTSIFPHGSWGRFLGVFAGGVATSLPPTEGLLAARQPPAGSWPGTAIRALCICVCTSLSGASVRVAGVNRQHARCCCCLPYCPCCACTCLHPVNACPGDVVHLDGISPPATYPKVLKLDEWKQVVPGLVVRSGKVSFGWIKEVLVFVCARPVLPLQADQL